MIVATPIQHQKCLQQHATTDSLVSNRSHSSTTISQNTKTVFKQEHQQTSSCFRPTISIGFDRLHPFQFAILILCTVSLCFDHVPFASADSSSPLAASLRSSPYSSSLSQSNPLFSRSVSLRSTTKPAPPSSGRSSSERRLFELISRQSSSQDFAQGIQKITIGAILPKTALKTVIRAYQKRLQDAVESLTTPRGAGTYFNFTAHFQIAHAQMILLSVNPSPTEILSALCDQLLPQQISAILYMSNSDVIGHNAASAQHLMQLTGYFGIPVIAWNPDNIGLEQVCWACSFFAAYSSDNSIGLFTTKTHFFKTCTFFLTCQF